MTTRSNEHLEKAYQSGHATNHHEGLRAVYQLGRADEAAALAPKQEIEAEPELASSQDSTTASSGQIAGEASDPDPTSTNVDVPAEQVQDQPEGQTPPAEAEPTPAS